MGLQIATQKRKTGNLVEMNLVKEYYFILEIRRNIFLR